MICLGLHETVPVLSILYLALFAVIFVLLALVFMKRRLVK
jgi:hypothetical protein